jgi:DNA-3-methyladenine glycosylase
LLRHTTKLVCLASAWHSISPIPEATPIATNLSQHLHKFFFCRPAEQVAPELIGCLLVTRQPSGDLMWGVIVETEAYSQEDPAWHGYRRRTPSNKMLFGEPGRFYVYLSYGIHHCVNVMTSPPLDFASGARPRSHRNGGPDGRAGGCGLKQPAGEGGQGSAPD